MPDVLARYRALVERGELAPDPAQEQAARALLTVAQGLEAAPPRGSILWRMLGRKPDPVRGLYLWGAVGRGKSMLMDLFFDAVAIPSKRRTHFHAYMLEVDARLREARAREEGDPIAPVAEALAQEARLLCFDEMAVTSTADAAIMARLFTALIEHGVTIVTTSNRRPQDLYKDGLNRALFLPFIALIEDRLDVVTLDGPTDYRRLRIGHEGTWFTPNGAATTAALSTAFFRLTGFPVEDRAHVPACDLDVGGGRTLHVPKCCKGVAVFSFRRLCGEPRGAADYLAIAREFHTVIIVGIPVMGPDNRSEAARFVTLIDALYEYGVKLLGGADALPDALYLAGEGSFEFARTASRLAEMQTEAYLAAGHGRD